MAFRLVFSCHHSGASMIWRRRGPLPDSHLLLNGKRTVNKGIGSQTRAVRTLKDGDEGAAREKVPAGRTEEVQDRVHIRRDHSHRRGQTRGSSGK